MTPLLYPAIDLLGGRAVRLRHGDRRTAKVYSEDPPAQARAFVAQGAQALHVVDLDAAFGEARQTAVLARIVDAAATVPVQVGGGMRDLEQMERTLEAGAARVIVGTAAVERPDLAGAIAGTALYEGGFSIRDAQAALDRVGERAGC